MSSSAAKPSLSLAIGSDHGGYDLKEQLKGQLVAKGYAVEDCGTFDKQPADYPVIAAAVAQRVADGRADRGIIIDGAGIGSSMAANKVRGVRAALCYDVSSARNSREHNDANVLTLGARLIGPGLAEQIVETFLATDCTEERHRQRVAMIDQIGEAGPATQAAPRSENIMEKQPTSTNMENLSPQDLDRIAAKIIELVGRDAWPAPTPCACCGNECRGHCAEKNPSAVRGFLAAGAQRIGHTLGGGPVDKDVAAYIDHTLLKPEATAEQVTQLCKEAAQFNFASVCINPSYVPLAAKLLRGTPVKVCTVAGFPLGTHMADVKAFESRRAIREGAKEVDMVINIGALKSGDDETVYEDIKAVVDACKDGGAICKVIIECALLTDDEKVRACQIARRARADFVKTSTGFASGGATAADVALMSEAVRGTRIGVKAAGGIRSYEDVQKMVAAGATRIGASAGVAIIQQAKGGAGSTTVAAAKPASDKY
jgi:deoxyribose-phosphate aldolase